METRSTGKTKLTEAEIQQLAIQLREKEERLRRESEALREQQQKIEQENSSVEERIRQGVEAALKARESDMRCEQRVPLEEEQSAIQERIRQEVEAAVKARESEIRREQRASLEEERAAMMNLIRQGVDFAFKERDLQEWGRTYPQTREIYDDLDRLRSEIGKLRRPPERPEPLRTCSPAATEDLSSDGIPVREAAEMVPEFDGTNLPVTQYVRACRKAVELISPRHENRLTRLLINRLKGRAYLAVEDEECHSINQLTDMLTEMFGTIKDIDQCRGEMTTIFKLPREPIFDYIARVKELRADIIEAERRRGTDITRTIELEINTFTTRSFIKGLPFEYQPMMQNAFYSTPFEAFARARQIARQIEINRERQGMREVKFEPKPKERNDDNVKRDHPGANAARSGTGSYNNPNGTPNSGEKICSYCKKIGHVIGDCYSRRNNEMRRSENLNGPSNSPGESRAQMGQLARPVRTIATEEQETTDSQKEEQTEQETEGFESQRPESN